MAINAEQLITGMEPAEDEIEFDLKKEFWLAQPYFSDKFASEVIERFGSHVDDWRTSPVGDTIWRSYRAYHNLADFGDEPITQMYESGENGELLNLDVNHYRGLVKHQISLITSQRPAWEPQARTSDSSASEQIAMVRNLMDFDMQSSLQDRLVEQMETAKVCASSFLVSGWDSNAGLDKRGWFTTRVLAPWEIAHEKTRDYDSDCSWWIFRTYESRWDWAARYAAKDPKTGKPYDQRKAKQIYDADTSNEEFANAFLGFGSQDYGGGGVRDRLPCLHLIARPSTACPEGRYGIVAAGNIVLMDGPNPFGNDVPISRMAASVFIGTSTPFSDTWSLMAPCEAYNGIMSMLMSRVDIGGVPNIQTPAGSEFTGRDVSGAGMLEVAPGQQSATVLDLLQIPQELLGVLGVLGQDLEKLSGINSVTRGQPAENISSGSMAALMQSMAVQFNSNDERAWALNMERVGTQRLRIFKQMASEELMISVCGADESYTGKSFKGEDVKDILKVTIKVANPLSKTVAGRLELAKDLLTNKACSPAEYMRVAETGYLAETFAGTGTHLNLTNSEKEMLLRGEKPRALWTDNHQLHIREHLELSTKDIRYNEQALAGLMAHIDEHMQLWEQLSREAPDRLAAIGCPPLPQASAMGQQGNQIKTSGMAPQTTPEPGPRQQEQPKTEEPPKGKPGPASIAPKGQAPSISSPAEPKPAKAPNGQPVV